MSWTWLIRVIIATTTTTTTIILILRLQQQKLLLLRILLLVWFYFIISYCSSFFFLFFFCPQEGNTSQPGRTKLFIEHLPGKCIKASHAKVAGREGGRARYKLGKPKIQKICLPRISSETAKLTMPFFFGNQSGYAYVHLCFGWSILNGLECLPGNEIMFFCI